MNLTLEERERLAYITNAPAHADIVAALEDDLRYAAEVKELEEENDQLDKLVSEANDAAEEAETQNEKLKDELFEATEKIESLEEKIHLAGVDLV
jgi:FtsZ-binding cell division protein ZapB